MKIAPKILASTQRAKQLAETIENQHGRSTPTPSSPQTSAARTRQIGGGISSRIKLFEPANSPERKPTTPTARGQLPNPVSSPSSSPTLARKPAPIPHVNGASPALPHASFVSTALESELTIRSGSAPPELTANTFPAAITHKSKLNYGVGSGVPNSNRNFSSHHPTSSESSIEHTLVQLRTPSQFNQTFPPLTDSPSDSSQQVQDLPDHPLPSLPDVPTTLPDKFSPSLPPPPQPFEVSSQTFDRAPSTGYSAPDQLVNDTSLGASLTNGDISPDNEVAPVGAPPPYPNFEDHSPPPSAFDRKFSLNTASTFQSPKNFQPPRTIGMALATQNLALDHRPHESTGVDSLPKLPPGINEILPATLIDYFRKAALSGVDTKVLFLDVRNRDDFESCRIKSTDVVCIEPLILNKNAGRGVTSTEIEQSLVLSPKKEQSLFERRQTFDYVIIYDKRSVQLPVYRSKSELLHSSDPTDQASRLLLLLYLAIHKEEYVKRLKQPPILLSGGIDGWAKVAGEAGLVGKGFLTQPTRQTTQTSDFTSSMNGVSITLRQPFNGEDNRTHHENQDDSSEIKRARRQVALFQRAGPAPPASSFIVRSVADLTRTNEAKYPPPMSTPVSSFQPSRVGLPPPYSSSGYLAHPNTSSPIALPQQTLQRVKSSELYDVNPTANEVVSSGYSSNPSNPMPLTLYQSHPLPSAAVPSSHYGPPQPLGRPLDVRYGGYIPNTLRPAIQYPPLQPHSRPLQMPPAALTPGGSNLMPNYFSPVPPYASVSSQTAYLGAEANGTSPITPFSPHRHGPSEVYFNPSFEDGQVGFTGLKNLGNTCYMNSIIQCLSATIPLARFFKDGSYRRCINRTNPLGTQGVLAQSVAELVRNLWGAGVAFISPVTFREAICRFAPQFRGSDQHDAQEFLAFLLDGLHEDLNLVINKPEPIEMTPDREAALESLPTQVASAREWEIYKRRDNSVIVELFQGQYRSRLQCLTCNTTSTTYNTFMYLSLPIPTKRGISKVSLTQCLDAFLKEEIMEKDDAWNCPKCKTRRKATKRLSLARLPPILLIHLKRFSFKGPFSDKLETFVQYPLYGLDLSSYVPPPLPSSALANGGLSNGGVNYEELSKPLPPDSHVYDLFAVCNHFGSLSSGHYTAFARSQKDWYNIGDSRVSRTDEKSVRARSAYLLWFRRRG